MLSWLLIGVIWVAGVMVLPKLLPPANRIRGLQQRRIHQQNEGNDYLGNGSATSSDNDPKGFDEKSNVLPPVLPDNQKSRNVEKDSSFSQKDDAIPALKVGDPEQATYSELQEEDPEDVNDGDDPTQIENDENQPTDQLSNPDKRKNRPIPVGAGIQVQVEEEREKKLISDSVDFSNNSLKRKPDDGPYTLPILRTPKTGPKSSVKVRTLRI